MTKKVLIADLKRFCNDSLSHFIDEQKAYPRMSAFYEYLEGRIVSLQLVLNFLEDYD